QAEYLAALAVPQVRVLPRLGERADHKGLSGTSGSNEGLDPGAGREHAAYGGGLVGAELDPALGELLEELGRAYRRHRRGAALDGARRKRALGPHVVRRRVQASAGCLVRGPSIRDTQVVRKVGVARPVGVERHGKLERGVGERV